METDPAVQSKEPLPRGKTFRSDFLASIVVFLVALPLCIGIAVAVGVSPARALITGIIGGVIVGCIAGSPLQVSGPAAGLFVIVADLLEKGRAAYVADGNFELADATVEAAAADFSLMVLGTSVFLAGLIQIAAGRLRLGQWFRAVSPAVIKGMLAGIGVLISVSQLHVMLDHQALWHGKKAHGAVQYLATIPEAILKCFSSDTSANHHLAALTGVIALVCFFLWPKLAPRRIRFVPAALVGIVAATLFATFMNLEVQRLEVPANMLSEVTLPSLSWMGLLINPMVLTGAFVIALVASAETLLCATAVDQMHQGPRTKYDQELTSQGIGNVICGLLGALPMTGVIVRSSANVESGAKTRLSAILHGVWLLIFVVAIPFVLTYIPRASLGALLVYTGFKLVNIRDLKSLWTTSRSEAAIYLATVIMIVCTDLLIGVVVGIALSGIKLLIQFSDLHVQLQTSDGDRKAILQLRGAATFLCLPNLAKELERVPDGAELHVDFEHLSYIDHACLDLLMNWARQHASFGGELVLDWDKLHGQFISDDRAVQLGAATKSVSSQDMAAAKEELASERP
jgi:MFS superfamily sulfate permease-like transporter